MRRGTRFSDQHTKGGGPRTYFLERRENIDQPMVPCRRTKAWMRGPYGLPWAAFLITSLKLREEDRSTVCHNHHNHYQYNPLSHFHDSRRRFPIKRFTVSASRAFFCSLTPPPLAPFEVVCAALLLLSFSLFQESAQRSRVVY